MCGHPADDNIFYISIGIVRGLRTRESIIALFEDIIEYSKSDAKNKVLAFSLSSETSNTESLRLCRNTHMCFT